MGPVLVLQNNLSPSISRMPGLVPQPDDVLEVLHMTPCTPALGHIPSHMARGSAPSCSKTLASLMWHRAITEEQGGEHRTADMSCTDTDEILGFLPTSSFHLLMMSMGSTWSSWSTQRWPGVRGGGAWRGFHPQDLEPYKSLFSSDPPQSQAWMTFSIPGTWTDLAISPRWCLVTQH